MSRLTNFAKGFELLHRVGFSQSIANLRKRYEVPAKRQKERKRERGGGERAVRLTGFYRLQLHLKRNFMRCPRIVLGYRGGYCLHSSRYSLASSSWVGEPYQWPLSRSSGTSRGSSMWSSPPGKILSPPSVPRERGGRAGRSTTGREKMAGSSKIASARCL